MLNDSSPESWQRCLSRGLGCYTSLIRVSRVLAWKFGNCLGLGFGVGMRGSLPHRIPLLIPYDLGISSSYVFPTVAIALSQQSSRSQYGVPVGKLLTSRQVYYACFCYRTFLSGSSGKSKLLEQTRMLYIVSTCQILAILYLQLL